MPDTVFIEYHPEYPNAAYRIKFYNDYNFKTEPYEIIIPDRVFAGLMEIGQIMLKQIGIKNLTWSDSE